MLFKHKEQALSFLDYLNNKHPNIKFTVEREAGDKLPFLDYSVCIGWVTDSSVLYIGNRPFLAWA